jgi:hypothetical protein
MRTITRLKIVLSIAGGILVSIVIPLVLDLIVPLPGASEMGYCILLPGMLLGALIIAPEGIHAGGIRGDLFGMVVLACNLGLYSVIIYPFVSCIFMLRSAGKNPRKLDGKGGHEGDRGQVCNSPAVQKNDKRRFD